MVLNIRFIHISLGSFFQMTLLCKFLMNYIILWCSIPFIYQFSVWVLFIAVPKKELKNRTNNYITLAVRETLFPPSVMNNWSKAQSFLKMYYYICTLNASSLRTYYLAQANCVFATCAN